MDFSEIKKTFEIEEKSREDIILESRKAIQLSKKIIYSINRDDLKDAEIHLIKLEELITKLHNQYDGTKHYFSGSFKIAVQEYIEAYSYYYFVKTGEIPKYDKKIDPEYYLLGLCDLSGELVRKALNDGIKGHFKNIIKVHKFISDLYSELEQFDFRNSDLRRKLDSIRWDLKKLEEMLFELKTRDKI